MDAAEQLFRKALELVDSESVRDWATSEHNRPLFIRLAQAAIDKQLSISDPNAFAAFVVAKAIGLID